MLHLKKGKRNISSLSGEHFLIESHPKVGGTLPILDGEVRPSSKERGTKLHRVASWWQFLHAGRPVFQGYHGRPHPDPGPHFDFLPNGVWPLNIIYFAADLFTVEIVRRSIRSTSVRKRRLCSVWLNTLRQDGP